MLQVLRVFYIKQLLEAGEEVTRMDAVSELLWGDLKHEAEAIQLLESLPKIEVTQPAQPAQAAQAAQPVQAAESVEFVEGNEGDILPPENGGTEKTELGLDDVLSDLEPADSEATK